MSGLKTSGMVYIAYRKADRKKDRHFLKYLLLCYAVAYPHLERSGMSTACPRSASAHLYHADGRLTSCDRAATDCI